MRSRGNHLLSSQFRRFCSVGLLNTAIDAGLYVALHKAGLSSVVANFISTSCGLSVSFALNSRYTFQTRRSPRQLALFLLVTCSGLWILQPAIIAAIAAAIGSNRSWAAVTLPKLCAIAVTFFWNYGWYTTRVFRRLPAA